MTARGAASGELQSMVDDLAESLGRSVVIDDPGIRLLCASRHFGDEDPVRVRSVLQRSAGSDIIAYVLGQAPDSWPGAGMLAGSVELGMLPRFCVPLRQQELLLGYLMVIDAGQTLTAREIEAIERCSRAAAAQLYADHAVDAESAATASALRDLLGAGAAAREAAQALLLRDRSLRDAHFTVVTAVAVEPGADTPAQVAAALGAGLRQFAQSTTVRGIVDGDRAALLQLRSRPLTGPELRAQARRLLETVGAMLDRSALPVAGVGGQAAGLRDAWISRRQALLAARAARRLGSPDGVGVWDELGELAVLVQLPDDVLLARSPAEPLAALAAHESGARLRETLRCYLDNAGSVPRTAATLHLHRTSLYYRLGQIRDITGLDLDDGRNRFLLHLALRLDDLGFPTE